MQLLAKDPDARLDYSIDWSAGWLESDSIVSSSWSVTPADVDGLQLLEDTHDGRLTSITLEGGQPGHLYRLSNQITTAGGRVEARSLGLQITDR